MGSSSAFMSGNLGDGIEIDLLLPLAWDHSPQSQCPGGVSLLGFQD